MQPQHYTHQCSNNTKSLADPRSLPQAGAGFVNPPLRSIDAAQCNWRSKRIPDSIRWGTSALWVGLSFSFNLSFFVFSTISERPVILTHDKDAARVCELADAEKDFIETLATEKDLDGNLIYSDTEVSTHV